MNLENRRIGLFLIVISIFSINAAYAQNTETAPPATTSSSEMQTISEGSATQDADDPKEVSGGFFPVGAMHEVLREERIATLKEIDIERRATLAYLTEERKAVMNEIKAEPVGKADDNG